MEFKQDYYGVAFFVILSVAFLGWWVWARFGYDKRWFVAPWPVVSKSFYFALPTAMIGILCMTIDIVLIINDPNSTPILIFVAFGLWGISYVVAYLEPDWMLPAWYRWLKKEHGDIMPYLVRDAHRLGRKVWLERVKTQEGLEEWANEVRRKYTRGGLR